MKVDVKMIMVRSHLMISENSVPVVYHDFIHPLFESRNSFLDVLPLEQTLSNHPNCKDELTLSGNALIICANWR